jgi:phage terminase small subunit
MAEQLNPKHKEFADEYLETGNATQSVKDIFKDVKDDNSAAVKGHRLLRNDKVQAYLEDNAEKAASRVVELSDQNENLNVALGASKDILDRAGFKPIEKTDITSGGKPIYDGQSIQKHDGDEADIQPEEKD